MSNYLLKQTFFNLSILALPNTRYKKLGRIMKLKKIYNSLSFLIFLHYIFNKKKILKFVVRIKSI